MLITAVLLSGTVADAGELRRGYDFFLHIGGAYSKQADEATLFLMGTQVQGAMYRTDAETTMAFELGAFLHKGWAVAVSGTVPTTSPNVAGGSIAAFGNLGDESVGYYSGTGQYHFNLRGPISPYVGAGVGYMHVFGTADGAVTDLDIQSAYGPVVQAGIDFQLNDVAGLYVDVKRFFIATTASGTIGGAAITADATVNPWVFSGGVGIRF